LNGKTLFAILLLIASITYADLVWWEYDLRSNPPGWIVDEEWEFTPDGLYFYAYITQPYSGEMGYILTAGVVVPPECDWVILHVEQELSISCYGTGGAFARLEYSKNYGDWMTLFNAGIYYETTEPLHYNILCDTWDVLEFRFEGFASTGSEMYPGWARIEWLLHDLTLTFHGPLALDQTTWGAIKGTLF
jgi:hypothetical protein